MARRKRNREPETAAIVSATHDGRGIADSDGKKVFVSGALPGETVEFRRRKFRRNFDEAELLRVFEASADRIDPKCAVFGRCGGCSMQHVSVDYQRDIKFQALQDNLERIGNVRPDEWLEPMTGPEWHYRRRARLAVKDVPGKGRVLVGFRERHAPFITDMHRCEVLVEPVASLLDPLSELIGKLSVRSRLPQIEVAVGGNATALVLRVLELPVETDRELLSAFGKQHGVRVYLQPGGLNSLQLLEPVSIEEPLRYSLPEFDLAIDFEPVDFVQVNAAINARMVHFAVEQLAPEIGDRVLDLFCGIGNFSLPIARRAGCVLGVDFEQNLVDRAARNAITNGLDNVEFRVADLAKLDGSESWLTNGWDKLLLDPARSGARDVVARVEIIDPSRIVYVSCHPGTLARDAGILVHEKGYNLSRAGIIDMFPHTSHVESIAVFTKL